MKLGHKKSNYKVIIETILLTHILIFSCFITACSKENDGKLDTMLIDLSYQDELYPLISERNLAVILIDFPDIPENIKAGFHTASEAQEYFFSPSIKEYFSAMSWGKFQYGGDVFGFFTMPDSLTEERKVNDYIIQTTESFDLNIPDFSIDKYTAVAFIIFHHEYEQRGLSAAGFANFTVNGKRYEKQNVMYMGAWINDTTNTYTRPIKYKIRYGNGQDDIYEKDHPIIWKYNQVILAHEFIHFIRGDINIPHSNTCTNNGKPDYATPDDDQPEYFQNLEYGNKFDLMGGGSLSLSLNGGYRKLAGWCDNTNTITIVEKGEIKNCKIYPINRDNGYRVIEIRLTNKQKHEDFSEYPGYFIEVREADKWDAPLKNTHLVENTKGLMVYKTDGFTTMLLDISPTKNFVNSVTGKHSVDYRDMSLKPEMVYENEEIKLSNVEYHLDGSYSVDIILK